MLRAHTQAAHEHALPADTNTCINLPEKNVCWLSFPPLSGDFGSFAMRDFFCQRLFI